MHILFKTSDVYWTKINVHLYYFYLDINDTLVTNESSKCRKYAFYIF